MANAAFQIFVFPGLLFLAVAGFAAEYLDRKLYARLQNRVGPPWFQPVADFVKLCAKEEVTPDDANRGIFRSMPFFAIAAAASAVFSIPLWRTTALFRFPGDLIIVLYLLTIPTLTFFLGGWYSTSLFSKIGAVRSLTQLFAYEVPLFMSILAPALLADTWSISVMTSFYARHPWYWLLNGIGFFISLVSILGKLERVPFDIPEAETEIVAGTFTEYGGRLFALFRLAVNIESVVAASLLAAVFLPFWTDAHPALGFLVYLAKLVFVLACLALLRTLFARLRIDQMISFCWKYMAPLAFLQLLINLIAKGLLVR